MIEFKNLTKKRVKREIFKKLYKKIFLKKFDLSVVFSSPTLMTQLNKKYKHKNKPADVLSFSLEKGHGEIFLNTGLHRRRAGGNNLPYLFTHGALHLLGYSHKIESKAKLMEKKEKFLVKSFKQ